MMQYIIFFCLTTNTMHHCTAMKLFSKRATDSQQKKSTQINPKSERVLSKRNATFLKNEDADPSIRVVIEISSKRDSEKGEIANTIAIDFSHNNLNDLPPLRDYAKLKELDCSYNLFKTISPSLWHCIFLQRLFLQHNLLKKIPDEIQQLIFLTELNLSHNHLTELPDKLGKLTELKHLNVAYNALSSIPNQITLLTQLIHFNIKKNQIHKNATHSLVRAMPHTTITW